MRCRSARLPRSSLPWTATAALSGSSARCVSKPIVNPEAPEVRLSLRRAGVSGVKRVVHLEIDGRANVYNADFSMVADGATDRAGVHMSRFVEALEEATLDVLADVATQPARIERLAETIARSIVDGQRASSADVRSNT